MMRAVKLVARRRLPPRLTTNREGHRGRPKQNRLNKRQPKQKPEAQQKHSPAAEAGSSAVRGHSRRHN